MKNILILVEKVGVDEIVDAKLIKLAREYCDDNIVSFYSREFVLNQAGEYLRAKGVNIYIQSVTLMSSIPNEQDVIVAFDVWGVKNSGSFQAGKKIRVSEESSLKSIIGEINKKEIKPSVKPVGKNKSKPASKK